MFREGCYVDRALWGGAAPGPLWGNLSSQIGALVSSHCHPSPSLTLRAGSAAVQGADIIPAAVCTCLLTEIQIFISAGW